MVERPNRSRPTYGLEIDIDTTSEGSPKDTDRLGGSPAGPSVFQLCRDSSGRPLRGSYMEPSVTYPHNREPVVVPRDGYQDDVIVSPMSLTQRLDEPCEAECDGLVGSEEVHRAGPSPSGLQGAED